MSIFKRANETETNKPSKVVTSAFFESQDFSVGDEFEALLKEASTHKSTYDNRVKNFKTAKSQATKEYQFEKPEPAFYDPSLGGIRRAGYGQAFEDEIAMSQNLENIRSAEYGAQESFSIWDPEFDALQSGFETGQRMDDQIFERRSAAEMKMAKNRAWEKEKMQTIREAKVLPYRGLGVSRLANEKPLHHGDFNSADEFYAQAHDDIREMVRSANDERRTKIQRNGVDPKERRDAWENKEAIAARTMKSLNDSSFLAQFADSFELK